MHIYNTTELHNAHIDCEKGKQTELVLLKNIMYIYDIMTLVWLLKYKKK